MKVETVLLFVIALVSRPAILIKSNSYTPTVGQKSEHENFPCINLNIFHSRKIEKKTEIVGATCDLLVKVVIL